MAGELDRLAFHSSMRIVRYDTVVSASKREADQCQTEPATAPHRRLRRRHRRRQPRRLRHRDPARPRRLRVALVEKQPDPQAFKRICSHFIQASAVPALERLDLLEPIEAAGGVRSRIRAWTPWGWIEAAAGAGAAAAVNLRRELLDPLVRETGRRDAGRRPDARAAPPPAWCARATRSPASRCATGGRGDELRARLVSAPTAATRGSRSSPRCAVRPTPTGASPTAPTSKARAPEDAPGQRDLVARPALGCGLPHRQRPHLLRGDADQGPAAGVQARPRGGAPRFIAGLPERAADPRGAPGRAT